MFREYKIKSIMIPENYVAITVEKDEFLRIIKENYSKKSKAIVYNINGLRYLIDAKANIVIYSECKENK